MKIDRFNIIIEEELERIKTILVKKEDEYSLDADRLSHFKHAAAMAGWTPEKALYGYMLKHLMSITDMINSGEKFPRALWQEKMTDIHNYLILLLGVLEDDNMFSETTKANTEVVLADLTAVYESSVESVETSSILDNLSDIKSDIDSDELFTINSINS